MFASPNPGLPMLLGSWPKIEDPKEMFYAKAIFGIDERRHPSTRANCRTRVSRASPRELASVCSSSA